MYTMLALIWLHFLADFLLQSNQMSIRKSSSFKWLCLHTTIYAAPFLVFGWQFAVITLVAHTTIDFVTSKINKHLWQNKKLHWFFTTIGADQALHLTQLYLTYLWLA